MWLVQCNVRFLVTLHAHKVEWCRECVGDDVELEMLYVCVVG